MSNLIGGLITENPTPPLVVVQSGRLQTTIHVPGVGPTGIGIFNGEFHPEVDLAPDGSTAAQIASSLVGRYGLHAGDPGATGGGELNTVDLTPIYQQAGASLPVSEQDRKDINMITGGQAWAIARVKQAEAALGTAPIQSSTPVSNTAPAPPAAPAVVAAPPATPAQKTSDAVSAFAVIWSGLRTQPNMTKALQAASTPAALREEIRAAFEAVLEAAAGAGAIDASGEISGS